MIKILDAFWRAFVYALTPRVLVLTLMPLVLLVVGVMVLAYFFLDPAQVWVTDAIETWPWLQAGFTFLSRWGFVAWQTVLATLIIAFTVTPLLVVLSLLSVSWLLSTPLLDGVARRRFPHMQRLRGGSLAGSVWFTLKSTLITLLVLILSFPLWWVPPFMFLLPPFIWGWLTYRVMAYDALAEHASVPERQEIFRRYRMALWSMGVVVGFMGAAPGLIWVSGAMLAAAFILLVPLAIWLYTWVFAFGALWFTHYGLNALHEMRLAQGVRPEDEKVIDVVANPASPQNSDSLSP
ncbi:MAG: EI24 domain-containing protein [Alphaproteobacteria bacterium]|nr:EI24 domain-containing protein [Alphaproteobacteria bacterium]